MITNERIHNSLSHFSDSSYIKIYRPTSSHLHLHPHCIIQTLHNPSQRKPSPPLRTTFSPLPPSITTDYSRNLPLPDPIDPTQLHLIHHDRKLGFQQNKRALIVLAIGEYVFEERCHGGGPTRWFLLSGGHVCLFDWVFAVDLVVSGRCVCDRVGEVRLEGVV